MRLSDSFLEGTLGRYVLLVPFAAMVGTVYGFRQAFHNVDSSGHATCSVAPGLSSALVATLAAMLLSLPLTAVWEWLVRGSSDDDGAA
ncbi:MAG TPA: MotA/TolQ/ExbB proton channel family protein [Methylomirabilota bacterium]|nr:MotA/TolQ/ExbB proton channel family protein [Methylomirabilota bacterium]